MGRAQVRPVTMSAKSNEMQVTRRPLLLFDVARRQNGNNRAAEVNKTVIDGSAQAVEQFIFRLTSLYRYFHIIIIKCSYFYQIK